MTTPSQKESACFSDENRSAPHIRRDISGAALAKLISHLGAKLSCAFLVAVLSVSVVAQKPDLDLTRASLEDLMNIDVTSVSRKEEKLFQTAAAVYVITQEEIRRSGLTTIPELLRLAPGLTVARIDGNKWAVSARGFNARLANKLLVLIDGRSVYSPETSGVYWEVLDLVLEDIERIEVIRGPGGTLWGANAVNGVINIITKATRDTGGVVVTAGAGTEDRGFGSFRFGSSLGKNASYRVYGKYSNRAELVDAFLRGANDGQRFGRGGGRVEWQPTERDELTLESDIYRTSVHENPTLISLANPFSPISDKQGEFTGGHIRGRWTRAFSETSDIGLQVYYDQFGRNHFSINDRINTLDIDFQHHAGWGRQDSIWGMGYRVVSHKVKSDSTSPVQFNPLEKRVQLFSAFLQDDITLAKDRLRLILGVKLGTVWISLGASSVQAQNDGSRQIVLDEFTKARPATASSKTQATAKTSPRRRPTAPRYTRRTPAVASASKSTSGTNELGVTIWRLRPGLGTDGGARVLVMENAKTTEWTPQRIEADTPLKVGERVRISIESPRAGYLYVVDREQFADGSLGDPYLIFPTLRTRGGDNQVRPGKLIDIPAQEDNPSYFTLVPTPGKGDQVAEVLSIIVTAQPWT